MVVGLPTTCAIGYQKKMFIGFTGGFSLSSLVQIVPVVVFWKKLLTYNADTDDERKVMTIAHMVGHVN